MAAAASAKRADKAMGFGQAVAVGQRRVELQIEMARLEGHRTLIGAGRRSQIASLVPGPSGSVRRTLGSFSNVAEITDRLRRRTSRRTR